MCSQLSGIAGKIEYLRGFLASQAPEKLIISGALDGLLGNQAVTRVLCAGKAGRSLARGAAPLFKGADGFLFETMDGAPGDVPRRFIHRAGEHPVPGRLSVKSTKHLCEWLMDGNGPLLALVSGGSSSLLCAPAPGWTLREVVSIEKRMLGSGMPIREINAVRLRLSRARGGGLRLRAGGWPVFTGVWCDVAPKQWRITGSAPMFWPGAIPRAENVAERRCLRLPRKLPPMLRVVESPFDRATCLCDADRLAEAAAALLKNEWPGARRLSVPEGISPGALARRFKKEALKPGDRPTVIIGCGEAPVRVAAKGRGGRCTHLACEVALALSTLAGWTFIALATDGVDGNAGSGAAISSETSPPEAMLRKALSDCDTGSLLEAYSCLLPRSPSGNNLRDLWLLFLE